jgi:hypothetical protein
MFWPIIPFQIPVVSGGEGVSNEHKYTHAQSGN